MDLELTWNGPEPELDDRLVFARYLLKLKVKETKKSTCTLLESRGHSSIAPPSKECSLNGFSSYLELSLWSSVPLNSCTPLLNGSGLLPTVSMGEYSSECPSGGGGGGLQDKLFWAKFGKIGILWARSAPENCPFPMIFG